MGEETSLWEFSSVLRVLGSLVVVVVVVVMVRTSCSPGLMHAWRDMGGSDSKGWLCLQVGTGLHCNELTLAVFTPRGPESSRAMKQVLKDLAWVDMFH